MARKKSAEQKPPKVKKRRWYHQVRDIFVDVQRQESSTVWIILAIVVATVGLGVGIGFWTGHPILSGITGLVLAFPIATWFLGRRAERLAYARIEGEPRSEERRVGEEPITH